MILFEKRNDKGNVVARNTDPAKKLSDFVNITISTTDGRLDIYTNDDDLAISKRFSSRISKIIVDVCDFFQKHFENQTDIQLHTLKKVHAHLNQKVEQLVPSPLLHQFETYESKRAIVVQNIAQDVERAADVVLFLHKKIFEMGAHMSSFELINMDKPILSDFRNHNLKRLLLSVLHGFSEQFKEKGIYWELDFSDELADNNKIPLDYKTINAALFNFFDNCVKYVKPNSQILFSFITKNNNFEINIRMMSLKVEPEEVEKIFDLGFRSQNAAQLKDGSGIGLYILKKALDLNNLTIVLKPNYSNSETVDNKIYVENTFIITGSLIRS